MRITDRTDRARTSGLSGAEPLSRVSIARLRESSEAGVTVVSTNLVLAESHALIMRRIGREVAHSFLSSARAAPNQVVYSSRELEERAEEGWLRRFDDQDVSLTDAVSFAIMVERGIGEALTLDRHFEIAGFSRAT